MENWPNDSASCDVLTNTNAGQTQQDVPVFYDRCDRWLFIIDRSIQSMYGHAYIYIYIYIYTYMDTLWSLN